MSVAWWISFKPRIGQGRSEKNRKGCERTYVGVGKRDGGMYGREGSRQRGEGFGSGAYDTCRILVRHVASAFLLDPGL